jgi:hypothetical protein
MISLVNQMEYHHGKGLLEKVFTPLEQERPLQTTFVAIERFFQRIDFQPGGYSKAGLLHIGCVHIVTHLDTSMPKKHSAVIQRPNIIFAVARGRKGFTRE